MNEKEWLDAFDAAEGEEWEALLLQMRDEWARQFCREHDIIMSTPDHFDGLACRMVGKSKDGEDVMEVGG